MRRTAPGWIVTSVLTALTAAQVVIAYLFWTSFGATSLVERALFPVVGCGLAIVEVFALVLASEATARGEGAKAWALRALFLALCLINLTADVAAVANLTGHDEQVRSLAVTELEALDARRVEVEAERGRLKAALQTDRLDLPPAAIAAQRDAAKGRRDRYIAERLTPPDRLVRETAHLESAYLTATRVQELEEEWGRIDQALLARPPVAAHHPQFETLSRLSSWTGVALTPETIRTALAFALALILKLTLAFGMWGATPRKTLDESTKPAEEGPPPDAPLPPARPKRARPARPLPSPANGDIVDALARYRGPDGSS
jgi:hypothetical protein